MYIHTYIYIYVYAYTFSLSTRLRSSGPQPRARPNIFFRQSFDIGLFGIVMDTFGLPPDRGLKPTTRGWRNTVEIVLFEISNSMKPYPSAVHACTSKLRPVIVLFEPNDLDEVSNRIPPTSQTSLFMY